MSMCLVLRFYDNFYDTPKTSIHIWRSTHTLYDADFVICYVLVMSL